MASFLENLTGTPGKVTQINRLAPGQQALQNQLISSVSGKLSNAGKNSFDFGPVAQEARNKFYTETIPSIAERFTAMGSGGSQSGSAFKGALGSAGAGLERGLASLNSQFGLQQQALDNNQLNALLQMAFHPQFENLFQEGQPGFLSSLGSGLGATAGYGLPDALSSIGSAFGPVGAAAGTGASALIRLISQLFNRPGSQQPVNPVPAENTPGARL